MAHDKHPIIIPDFAEVQEQKFGLPDRSGLNFYAMRHILYAEASGCYTTFYLTELPEQEKCREIVVCHHIGFYDVLENFGFARANKGIVFNLRYLKCITRSREVVLTRKHGLIQVTPAYWKELWEKLEGTDKGS